MILLDFFSNKQKMSAQPELQYPGGLTVTFDSTIKESDPLQILTVEIECLNYQIPIFSGALPNIDITISGTIIRANYYVEYQGKHLDIATQTKNVYKFVIVWSNYNSEQTYILIVMNEHPIRPTTVAFNYARFIKGRKSVHIHKVRSKSPLNNSIQLCCVFIDRTTKRILDVGTFTTPEHITYWWLCIKYLLRYLTDARPGSFLFGYNTITAMYSNTPGKEYEFGSNCIISVFVSRNAIDVPEPIHLKRHRSEINTTPNGEIEKLGSALPENEQLEITTLSLLDNTDDTTSSSSTSLPPSLVLDQSSSSSSTDPPVTKKARTRKIAPKKD